MLAIRRPWAAETPVEGDLFMVTRYPQLFCVFQRRGEDDWRNFARPTRRAAEKQRIIRRCVTMNRPLLRSYTCVFDCVFLIVLALAGFAETVLRQSRPGPQYVRMPNRRTR